MTAPAEGGREAVGAWCTCSHVGRGTWHVAVQRRSALWLFQRCADLVAACVAHSERALGVE